MEAKQMSNDTTADQSPHRYCAALAGRIEQTWQDHWAQNGTYHAPNPAGPWAEPHKVNDREKLLVLDMFPYPSGAGLHVGHPLGYIATDVYSRYHRMRGKNVLHCLGYDAFGLPAEQYAIQTGQHPEKTTTQSVDAMAAQLRRLGLGHDDRRTISTIDPAYYRWTQWIFLQIFNAWYDTEAPRPSGGHGKARPIKELVAELETGKRALTGDFTGREWADLTDVERATYLDSHRLVYSDDAPVNWAPGLGTVVANEEVTNDGRTERGNFPVFRTKMSQWKMRITAYADRLADDLDGVDWPEKIKLMQRNWIGRATGARVDFTAPSATGTETLTVFTTRPDTLFGSTFMALAPEHPAVDQIMTNTWPEGTKPAWTGGATTPAEAINAYRIEASRKSDRERQIDDKTKTGVFTGAYATNPVSGKPVPVFIADYVAMDYGTGAVMAVPAHDARDYEFATVYELDIIDVVRPTGNTDWAGALETGEAFTDTGEVINSTHADLTLDGLPSTDAAKTVTDWLVANGKGDATINYRMRDWLFSRQRYWGEPFPIVYDNNGIAHAVPESQLPVELPEVDDYSPKTFDPDDHESRPEAPLAKATDWVNVTLDLGDGPKQYRRETNTMPNWAGSCWYYLRYLDAGNDTAFVDPANEKYWLAPGENDLGGVDLYVGGAEHAVLHLLYARFWHKVLHDLGHVESQEPFRKYFAQGYIQAYAYRDDRGQPVPAAEVVEQDGSFTWNGAPVTREYGKMGKSLKNTVTPDEMCEAYGADTFRVYEMSMGPLEQSKPWDTRAVVGAQRFLQRVWRNIIDEQSGNVTVVDEPLDDATAKLLAQVTDQVGQDYDALRFNTGIAKLIQLNNALTKLPAVPRAAAEALVIMMAPVAPHIAEELWHRLGHEDTVVFQTFPEADPALLVEDTVTCVVQVMGKVRDRLEVPASITSEDLEAMALGSETIKKFIDGKQIRKVVVVLPKLVNIVAT